MLPQLFCLSLNWVRMIMSFIIHYLDSQGCERFGV